MNSGKLDAVVVGSGPNGLSAAITLARAGRSVLVLEAESTWGGGMRTSELTLPGFHHDVCSSAHPMLAGSPFFRGLKLTDLGQRRAQVHGSSPAALVRGPWDGAIHRDVELEDAGTVAIPGQPLAVGVGEVGAGDVHDLLRRHIEEDGTALGNVAQ